VRPTGCEKRISTSHAALDQTNDECGELMKVLFVGATGRIGRQVVPLLSPLFDLVLAAREADEVAGLPVHPVDICDFGATQELLQSSGATAVINCAIAEDRSQFHDREAKRRERTHPHIEIRRQYHERRHEYREHSLDVNVRGAYHLYEAAARAGVAKFVFVSSITVVLGQPRFETIMGDEAPHPANFYACTKYFGEQIGALYSSRYGMAVTCLRLGHPYPLQDHEKERLMSSSASRALLVHVEDISQAFEGALRETLPFACYPIVSASDAPWIAESAYHALGYSPRYLFTSEGVELRKSHSGNVVSRGNLASATS
jgi:nucleoside-diphosphate-sugar epimerase